MFQDQDMKIVGEKPSDDVKKNKELYGDAAEYEREKAQGNIEKAKKLLKENNYIEIDVDWHIHLSEEGRLKAESIYERHTTKGEIQIEKDLEEELTKIDILSAEIETCLKEIMKLKNKKQCEKCFAEIDLDAKFCGNCGAEQNGGKVQEETTLEEVGETQMNSVVENSDETTSSDVNPEEVNSEEVNPEEVNPEETNPEVSHEVNSEDDTNK